MRVRQRTFLACLAAALLVACAIGDRHVEIAQPDASAGSSGSGGGADISSGGMLAIGGQSATTDNTGSIGGEQAGAAGMRTAVGGAGGDGGREGGMGAAAGDLGNAGDAGNSAAGAAGDGSAGANAALTPHTVNLGTIQHCGVQGGTASDGYTAPIGSYIDPSSVKYGRGGCGECKVTFAGPADKPTGIVVEIVHTFDPFGCSSECAFCDYVGGPVNFTVFGP